MADVHWQDDFARRAAMLDLNLIMAHRFVTRLEGEDREEFDRLMNRAHRDLMALVKIINPTWLSDPDEIDTGRPAEPAGPATH
jgi:hypothetical protein